MNKLLIIAGTFAVLVLGAGQTEVIAFAATDPGIYKYGLHGHCSGIGSIKVANSNGVVPTEMPEEEHLEAKTTPSDEEGHGVEETDGH